MGKMVSGGRVGGDGGGDLRGLTENKENTLWACTKPSVSNFNLKISQRKLERWLSEDSS